MKASGGLYCDNNMFPNIQDDSDVEHCRVHDTDNNKLYIYKDFESFYIIGGILKCSSITFDINESLSQKALNILLSNEKLKYLK